MFWEILGGLVLLYLVAGVCCMPAFSRDAYRRSKLKNTGFSEERHRAYSVGEAWGMSVFWPVYLSMRVGMKTLENDQQEEVQTEQTKRMLESYTEGPKIDWMWDYTKAELDARKRNNLNDEGG